MRRKLAQAFNKDEVTLSAYLDGICPLSVIFPPPPTALEQAISLEREGRWSEAAQKLAKELEAKLSEESKSLTVPEWVRQLDALESESRKTIKTMWERLLEDDDF